MAWITLTREGLKTKLSKVELDKIPAAIKAAGKTPEQVLDKEVSDMVREIRGFVAVKNPLGAVGTIPDELEKSALSLIRRSIFTSVPGLTELFDQTRQSEARYAEGILRSVASGSFVIVPPVDPAPSTEQAAYPLPSIKRKTNNFSLENQDGI